MGPIAVVGKTGQVARALGVAASARGVPLVARGRPDVDLGDADGLAAYLSEIHPRLVINAAAYTAVDKAENEREACFRVNAEGPATLAAACAALGVPLIHLSTDYVFGGDGDRPYREDDPIAPSSVYGASKAAGERAIRASLPRHIILRTAWVYDGQGQNFLRTMLRLAAGRDEIGVVDDQTGSPTYAPDIAAAILDIAAAVASRGADEDRWGTYHLTSDGTTTWAGFARAIFTAAGPIGFKTATVRPITTADYPTPARRPAYSVLDNSRIRSAFGVRMPHWRQALDRCLTDMAP